MNNTTTKTFGRNFDFGKNFFATSFDEEKKTSSSFYDDYVKRSGKKTTKDTVKELAKIPVPVSLSSSPKIPNTFEEITESSGSEIKKNIESVLTKKYGALDVAHTFDSIPDKDIEANIKVAKNTVQTNVDKGLLDKDFSVKLPNLVSGLALSFAAAEKGNSKAAKRAREAAYTEQKSVTSFDNLLLNASNNQPTIQPTKYSSFYDDYLKNKNSSDSKNLLNNTSKAFDLPKINKNPRYVSADVLNMRSAPGTDSQVVGKLVDGTEVNYTGNKTEEIDGHLWAEVTYGGKTGWVDSQFLRTQKPTGTSVKVNYDEIAPKKDNDDALLTPPIDSGTKSNNVWNGNSFSYIAPNGNKITPSNSIQGYIEEYFSDSYNTGKTTTELLINPDQLKHLHKYLSDAVKSAERPPNIAKGIWEKQVQTDLNWIDDVFGTGSKFSKALKAMPAITIGIDTLRGIEENIKNQSNLKETLSDAGIDLVAGGLEALAAVGLPAALSYVVPALAGGVPGLIVSILAGLATNYALDHAKYGGDKTIKETIDSKF